MKKVLILAYDFPPYVSVGGLRPYSWYKYFKEFGLYPIVVTRQWGNKYGNQLDYVAPSESSETLTEETEFGTLIRTPYKPIMSHRLLIKYGENRFRLFRKIISAYFEIIQFLFYIGPKSQIYLGAKSFLERQKVDLIIATGEPFVLFKYASDLSSKYNIPWLADYRDLWSLNNDRSNNRLIKFIYHKIEKRIVGTAKMFVTVSDVLKHSLTSIDNSKEIEIVTNGYDGEVYNNEIIQQNNDFLTISFAGTLYNWHPWEKFLEICEQLILEDNIKLRIQFFGVNISNKILDFCQTRSEALMQSVILSPKLQSKQLSVELQKSNLLLLFNDYSYMGTKIYDYLASKRQILFCFTDYKLATELKIKHFSLKNDSGIMEDLQARLIQNTNSGCLIKDSEHLQETLQTLYQEFISNCKILCNSRGFEKYSRKEQSKILANLIKENY